MTDFYILGGDSGHDSVPCDIWSYMGWVAENDDKRQVAHDEVGGVRVSTVFLGFDHGHEISGRSAPVLYETMIFRHGKSLGCRRCSTWAEAEAMHARIVEAVRDNPKAFD